MLTPQLPPVLIEQGNSDLYRERLLNLSWTERTFSVFEQLCRRVNPEQVLQSSLQFASLVFQVFFEAELQGASVAEQGSLLNHSLDVLGSPSDLTAETGAFSSNIWPDISPHARFWSVFAATVSRVFPSQAMLVSDDLLARRVHQLRYVISAQQAAWVRRHYGGLGISDREALVAYLATADVKDQWLEWLGLAPYDLVMTYDLGESARFHNKRQRGKMDLSAQPFLSKTLPTMNLKILVNWHSEFILSSQGELLTIWPATQPYGVVNGASFNYSLGPGIRHRDLDICPVGTHDPAYRRRLTRGGGYRSPNRRRWWFWWSEEDWEDSFYNKQGRFAVQGRSCAQVIQAMAADLQLAIAKRRRSARR